MSLQKLAIDNFRNLEQVRLEPTPHLNLVTGPNASGKTSLLEAIHYLAMARSFRSNKTSSIIRYDANSLQVVATVHRETTGTTTHIGIERQRSGELTLRVGGHDARSRAEIIEWLPIQIIAAGVPALLEGGPTERRRFNDWGVFHVEHRFMETWRHYRKALQQRNRALREGLPAQLVTAWDDELLRHGSQLIQMKSDYVKALLPYAAPYLAPLEQEFGAVEIEFRPGHPRGMGLEEALAQSLNWDREHGYTHYGPHRSDLSIKAGSRPAGEILSRGQQKHLNSALKLAQVHHLRETNGKHCIVLLDDITAELDQGHVAALLHDLLQLQTQLFVTSLDESIVNLVPRDVDRRMFHVKHGRFEAVI